MSTLTADRTPAPAFRDRVQVGRVTWPRAVVSEWIKLRSLRSTGLTLFAAVGAMIGIGWLFGWASNANWSDLWPDEQAAFNAIDTTLAGYGLAHLAIGVLGVLLVTGEYATGMIRATLTAVPTRLRVLWAKAFVFAVVTFVLMLVASFVAFLGGQQLLGSHGTSLSADGAVRAIVGVAVYLTLIAVFAVAMGFVLRSTAGGVAFILGLLLLLPTMGLLLPPRWKEHLLPYLPSNAGVSLFGARPAEDALSSGAGLLVLLVWVGSALVGAALLLRRRDT